MGVLSRVLSRETALGIKNPEVDSISFSPSTLAEVEERFALKLVNCSPESLPRLLVALTGKYPSRSEVDRWQTISQWPIRRIRSTVRRALRSRDSRTVALMTKAKVIDVSRFANAHKSSGIPRVVRTLIGSSAAADYVLAVWDRGALAPVELDNQGRVEFPRRYWRATPRFSAVVGLLLSFRVTRWGSVLLFPLERLGILRGLGNWLLWWSTNPHRRTRARVNIDLTDAELQILEIPLREDSQRVTQWALGEKSTDIVVFVHDLLPLSHPQYFNDSSSTAHLELLKVLPIARKVVTSSSILRDQIRQTLKGLHGVDMPISVAELPVSETFTSQSPRLAQDYYCFVGGFEKRKGIDVALKAWRTFDRGEEILKVVGSPSLAKYDEMPRFLSARGTERVEVLGALKDSQLIEVMAGARAVLYLSPAEGYGLPILEALSLGVPVVCCDTPINRHFAEKYAGIRLLPVRGTSVDPEALAALLDSGSELRELRREVDPEQIPADVEAWSKQVLGIASDERMSGN